MKHSITNDAGEVVDEYDDEEAAASEEDASGEVSHPDTSPPPAQIETDKVEASQDQERSEPRKAPVTASVPVAVQKEDPTDFDGSDVRIEITIQRSDGHPEGRLVSLVIHNFSGQPLIQDFRETELTDRARLDSLHRAIYPLMQRFLLELSARKQKKLEEAAKRAPRPTPQPRPGATAPTAASTPAPTVPPTPAPAPAQQVPAKDAGKPNGKGKANGKQSKYQAIPMF